MKPLILLFGLCCLSACAFAADEIPIKIGVQATGTLAWELAVLSADDASKPSAVKSVFKIEQIPLANSEAGKIAIQSGSVDMIVADWLWVTRLRSEGSDLTLYPYSTTTGALLVPSASPTKTINDLKGKKLGIAGGELDKNWLLLQALAQQQKLDLNANVGKVFGAPPLLNEQLRLGRLDAVLTYWHFGTQLEGQGYRQLIDGSQILQALGIQDKVPFLGYVFRQSWAESHKAALSAFLHASQQAKHLLCTSESAWKKIAPLTNTPDPSVQSKLRQRYCEGEVKQWGKAEQQAAERVYELLREVSNQQLTGKSEKVQPGTFWQ